MIQKPLTLSTLGADRRVMRVLASMGAAHSDAYDAASFAEAAASRNSLAARTVAKRMARWGLLEIHAARAREGGFRIRLTPLGHKLAQHAAAINQILPTENRTQAEGADLRRTGEPDSTRT